MKNRLILCSFLCLFEWTLSHAYGQGESASFFSFEPDFRIFTTHAFMNAAGFDGEWRATGMDTLRKEIRALLFSRLSTSEIEKMKDFRVSSGNGSWSGWAMYGLITNGYPNFEIAYDEATSDVNDVENRFDGLSPLLKEFCEKVELKHLWDTHYETLLRSRNERYRPYAEEALRNIIEYCKLENGYFDHIASKIHFQVSPLMSFFTAQTVQVNGEIWLINSSSESLPGTATFYHELLHYVINPLVERNEEELKRLQVLNEVVEGHDSAYEIVIESFVRTFDKILYQSTAEDTRRIIDDEYGLGFLLCPLIYESISVLRRPICLWMSL